MTRGRSQPVYTFEQPRHITDVDGGIQTVRWVVPRLRATCELANAFAGDRRVASGCGDTIASFCARRFGRSVSLYDDDTTESFNRCIKWKRADPAIGMIAGLSESGP